MSCNELGWEGLSAEKTPLVVLVASSTGDGDPPDNAAKFFATMKCASAIVLTDAHASQSLWLVHMHCSSRQHALAKTHTGVSQSSSTAAGHSGG